MTCKRITHTLLALLLPLTLAGLASLGCGGNNGRVDPPPPPPPTLSGEAGIAGLAVSAGELSPAFSAGVNNYTAQTGYTGESSIGVTATLKDAKASLTINGVAAASGVASNIALGKGPNTIRLTVTAEDGKNFNLVTLHVDRLTLNTSVWVLNGIMGRPVENTVLKLTDSRGKVLADNVPLPNAKNGAAVFGLDPREKYNIYATGDNSAVACLANFDRAKEDTANLYCLHNSTTYYELEAPVIESISFGTANNSAGGAGWRIMPNDACYVGTLANVAAVRVQVLTRNTIAGSTEASSYDLGPALRVNIDETASINLNPTAMGATGTAISENEPVTIGGRLWYRSAYRCATPMLSTSIFNKEHYLSVVTYDGIGNRTEQRVYLTITDSANAVIGDPDLSAVAPAWDMMQAQAMMGGGDLAGRPGDEASAMDPVDPYTGYQQVMGQFYVRATGTATNLGVRGFEVWRSLGAPDNFVRIMTVNFATLITGAPFAFSDRSPSLVAGDVHYRIRAFNGNPANNGFSPLSPSFRLTVMPPTITRPAATFKTVSGKLWPQFRIAASNPLMLNKSVTDYFAFTLFVKYADNPYPFLLIPMRVRFTETDGLTGVNDNNPLPADDARNKHRYGFEPGKPTVQYLQVTSYTSSSSTASGTWNYAYDSKEVQGEDDEGNPITTTVYTPFAYLADDGSVVIDTGTAAFRRAMNNQVRVAHGNTGEVFAPGATYHWNLFGNNGGILWVNDQYPANWSSTNATNAAYFWKGLNTNGSTYLSLSYGSNLGFGYGSPEGWFPLTIAADAE